MRRWGEEEVRRLTRWPKSVTQAATEHELGTLYLEQIVLKQIQTEINPKGAKIARKKIMS